MLYIIEGCDATGKSTLAKMLASTLDAQIIHCTTETPNTFKFFNEIIYASEYTNVIADRFCYGQFVYQDSEHRPLKPKPSTDKTDMDWCSYKDEWEALYDLETRMLRNNTKLIYCHANPNIIADRMIARGENPVDVSNILHGYKELWTRTLLQPVYFRT